MAVIKTVINLPDGKAAVKIDGIASSSVYVRVRKTRSEQVQNGNLTDTVLSAQAYPVNSDGTDSTDSSGPEIGTTLHASMPNLTPALTRLSGSAVDAFITQYVSKQAISELPENLPLS